MKETIENVRILILNRGWVLVGRVTREENEVVIRDAKILRRWGTTNGLGELRNGPLSGTNLDAAGTVRCHPLQVIATIDVDARAWESSLGR